MAVVKKNETFYTHDWIRLIEIDYFSAFVKVYIPFNAWMNQNIEGDTDRVKINRIKDSENAVRTKISSLLRAGGQEGESFRTAVGSLHTALENSAVSNNGEKISFEDVYFGPNKNLDAETQRRGVTYHAHYSESKGAEKTILTIRNRKGESMHTCIFEAYPAKAEVVSNSDFSSIKPEWQDVLLPLYQQVNPHVMGSLLTRDEKRNIKCGTITMISEETKLAAGLIEIIYNLRNALFHGIINPNAEANVVYGAAYRVLYPLIKSLA